MSHHSLDYGWVSEAMKLEVEAVEGGRPQNEFALAPPHTRGPAGESDEISVLGVPPDDAADTEERAELLARYLPHATRAYRQRGLVYPFQRAPGNRLVVSNRRESRPIAERAAEIGSWLSDRAHAKDFERLGFEALHGWVGGWAVGIGAPRANGLGPHAAVRRFRQDLLETERGDFFQEAYEPNGDLGADGFVILGRGWGGPLFLYQAKNSFYSWRDSVEEFGRIGQIVQDWFGKELNLDRVVVPVLAVNSVLQLEDKANINRSRHDARIQIVDVVDMLAIRFTSPRHDVRVNRCSHH